MVQVPISVTISNFRSPAFLQRSNSIGSEFCIIDYVLYTQKLDCEHNTTCTPIVEECVKAIAVSL